MEKSMNGSSGEDVIDIDEWVVVTTVSGSKVFGRLGENHAVHSMVDMSKTSDRKKRALIVAGEDGLLEISPAYYLKDDPMFVQGPHGPGVQRSPLILPRGFTTQDTAAYVKPTEIDFCSDMCPSDKTDYEMFVRQVRATMVNARMNKSGLSLAGPDDLPRISGRR